MITKLELWESDSVWILDREKMEDKKACMSYEEGAVEIAKLLYAHIPATTLECLLNHLANAVRQIDSAVLYNERYLERKLHIAIENLAEEEL
jgi:hypothetical protein